MAFSRVRSYFDNSSETAVDKKMQYRTILLLQNPLETGSVMRQNKWQRIVCI